MVPSGSWLRLARPGVLLPLFVAAVVLGMASVLPTATPTSAMPLMCVPTPMPTGVCHWKDNCTGFRIFDCSCCYTYWSDIYNPQTPSGQALGCDQDELAHPIIVVKLCEPSNTAPTLRALISCGTYTIIGPMVGVGIGPPYLYWSYEPSCESSLLCNGKLYLDVAAPTCIAEIAVSWECCCCV